MGSQGHISFEDWIAWVFDRTSGDWVWEEDYGGDAWFTNDRLMAEYFIDVHTNSVELLSDFSNDQIGWGLWNL